MILREGLHTSFHIPLMPELPRKRSRNEPEGPPRQLLYNRLFDERTALATTQANAQLGNPNMGDKPFEQLLNKFSASDKCLVKRHAKISALDLNAAKKEAADTSASIMAVSNAEAGDLRTQN